MTDDEDDSCNDEAQYGNIGTHTCSQAVEHAGQDTSRETEGEKTYVGEHVAQQAGYHIIGIPQAKADVEEDVLTGAVVKEYHAAGKNHHYHKPYGTSGAREYTYGNTNEQQYPSDSAHSILEAQLNGEVHGLEYHAEEYLHASDDEREVEHGLIVLEEQRLHLLEEGKVDIV